MRAPSSHPGSPSHRPNRPGKRPKDAPSDNLVLRGFNALKNITAVQALIGLAALGATGYIVSRPTDQATIEEQEKAAASIKPYTPELYPTVESRVTYLRDKYGIDASILDSDHAYNQSHITVRTETTDECGCKKVHYSERDLAKKVKAGDPKHFLVFLDGICRAADRYPIDLFREMRGLKLDMSGEIKYEGTSERYVNGYADGPSHIVMDGNSDSDGTQETFHHEFLHALDFAHNDLIADDDQWMLKTGAKDTTYLGYSSPFDDRPWSPPPGFARKYGMASVPEDQATMGENFFQPHHLKFMIRRAIMGDKALLMRIQLMTGCVIDPVTERFSKTMTAQDYSVYSGFDGYRYYRAWSSKMDHTFWNSQLDAVSPESESRKHVARNMYDAIADLIYHIDGDDSARAGRHDEAAKSYVAAHESKLATVQQRIAATESEKKGDFFTAAITYDAMGEKEKARQLYEKYALNSVSRNEWSEAALAYAKAGKLSEARNYASKFFEVCSHSTLRLFAGNKEIFAIDETLMKVVQECYNWTGLPDIAIDLLHTSAKKRGGITAITIYEKLGEVRERATRSARNANKGKKHPDPIDTETLIDEWYLKHAKRLEAEGGVRLDQVALLYEKAGKFDEAKRCLQLSLNAPGYDWFQLADVYRTLADLVDREEKKSIEKPAKEALK